MAITEVKNNYYTQKETNAETRVKEPNKETNTEARVKDQKKETNTYGSAKEYGEYIYNKYSCLQPSKNNLVTIAPDLLSKGATDEKTSQWLEYNLNLIPDVMDNIYENAAKGGGKVLSCNISFDGYDSITTQVHAVYEADPGTEEAKKLLEEARAKNKDRRVQQERILEKKKEKKLEEENLEEEKAENIRSKTMVTDSVESLFKLVENIKFDNENRISIDIKG